MAATPEIFFTDTERYGEQSSFRIDRESDRCWAQRGFKGH